MARTPSSRTGKEHPTPSKTPQSKHRLHFPNPKNPHPSPNPLSVIRENIPTEHPVEVIGRIRDYPDRKDKPLSALEISQDGRSVRVRTDFGYRDFSLDGMSVSEDEDLDGFYKKFVEPRIDGVRLGAKCTIMMYGPTGSGKSHTMFGCAKQPGIVYRALRDILGEGDGENDGVDNGGFGVGLFVQVAVLEIYNEEIYDLLSSNNGGGANVGLPKGNTPKVRLEVMGKKAKNASYISGNEAVKISREVTKVEKRRIVKSTLCNERSSRSHCLIILDVPSVGGRLMLVDMAGSENIEQAGQTGFEAKVQTAKINQGNIALKRVVESIANGDSHVPFRDSKLTMLLQDSFEDDKSKILMILCASPDPKEMHKTISTLEYGAKAKCIVRVAHMPTPKDKPHSEESSSVVLGSRIVAMNQFIYKLQMENKLKEKERDEARKELMRKEEEMTELRTKLKLMEGQGFAVRDEEIKSKVDERTNALRLELEKMEEKMMLQQEEIEMLRRQLEELECQRAKVGRDALQDVDGGRFVKRLSELYVENDRGMEKSMELDTGDQPMIVHDVKEIKEDAHHLPPNFFANSPLNPCRLDMEEEDDTLISRFPPKVCLSTVFEGDEEEEDFLGGEEVEVEKEVVKENMVNINNSAQTLNFYSMDLEEGPGIIDNLENSKDAASARRTRIQNIFRLCGNHRELAQQVKIPTPPKRKPEAEMIQMPPTLALREPPHSKEEVLQLQTPQSDMTVTESPVSALLLPLSALNLADEQKSAESQSVKRHASSDKENSKPGEEEEETRGLVDVFVKWETSRELSGNLIKKLKVLKNSSLADLRKLIETHFSEENNKKQEEFTFLLLGDPNGGPVSKEKEATVQVNRLPICCNNQLGGHLACLRSAKKTIQRPDHLPFTSLENKLLVSLNSPSTISQQADGFSFSPKISHNISYLTGVHRM